ncbi:hypothetical protein GW17_00016502 [Ensete ventricosum]|nr:hypothetical protein GW17_00016502 [Ensete ventricosum]
MGTAPESQQVEDPPSFKFRWTIENFSRLNIKKLYSDIFYVGGYKWRVLIFPKGNNVDHLSLYLDVADSTTLPYGWSRYAQFALAVVNQIHSKYTIRKGFTLLLSIQFFYHFSTACSLRWGWAQLSEMECIQVDTQHQFNSRESDWGFTSFMSLSELYDPSRGYLVNDTCVIEAEVVVRRVDAKKGVLFIDFPPVLQLQLKRFEYDFMRDTMVKVSDTNAAEVLLTEQPLQFVLDNVFLEPKI